MSTFVFFLLSFTLILWPLLSKAPLYPRLGHGEQRQPSSKLQQSLSFILAYSPSPPHAVLPAAPNSSICPAGLWQEATTVFLQPNFDWPTSSSHSRVLYFFPFLACTKLHSSKGTYAAMEIILEVTQALLLFVPQLTPTESEQSGRGDDCRNLL